MYFLAGRDRGVRGHAVCVVDERHPMQASFDARHAAAGLAELLAPPKRIARPGALPVALESPSGLVPETLIAAGHPAASIHPDVAKACRARCHAAGAKADPGVASLLASVLRDDCHRVRALAPLSGDPRALRPWLRVPWRAWTNHVPQDPKPQRAARIVIQSPAG